MAMPERELDQAKRHPDVVKNIIKKDGRKDAIPYTPSNPPPYPVTSVNGQTGDVTIPPTSGGRIWYATCSTSAGVGAKVATTSTGDFALATGSMVRLKCTTANTALNPTLSIDGSTQKTIQPKSGTSGMDYRWRAQEVIDLVYDGSNFIMSLGPEADTSYYGITKLNSATNSTSTKEAATPSAVKAAYDLADAKVDKAGDTMTGNLFVAKAGDTYVEVQDTDTQCRLMMDSYTSGTHGLWSSGYNDGTYHSNGRWLVRRKSDGSVTVDGDCTGTADNVTGTVAIAHGGTGATDADTARANLGLGATRFFQTPAPANSSITITFPASSCMGAIFTSGASSAKRSMYLFGTTSAGTVGATRVFAGADVSASESGNKLTISNTASGYLFVNIMQWAGTSVTIS